MGVPLSQKTNGSCVAPNPNIYSVQYLWNQDETEGHIITFPLPSAETHRLIWSQCFQRMYGLNISSVCIQGAEVYISVVLPPRLDIYLSFLCHPNILPNKQDSRTWQNLTGNSLLIFWMGPLWNILLVATCFTSRDTTVQYSVSLKAYLFFAVRRWIWSKVWFFLNPNWKSGTLIRRHCNRIFYVRCGAVCWLVKF